VVIDLTVSQGERREQESIRVVELKPEQEVEVLEFNVDENGGAIQIRGSIQADEGKLEWQQRL
jgi:hypothetical protein